MNKLMDCVDDLIREVGDYVDENAGKILLGVLIILSWVAMFVCVLSGWSS